jgi:hypothetical protein
MGAIAAPCNRPWPKGSMEHMSREERNLDDA